MTLIDFYSGSNDKLLTVCRLSAKAIQQNLKITIYTPDTKIADQLDSLLWNFSSTAFIPHCRVEDKIAFETPLTISQN